MTTPPVRYRCCPHCAEDPVHALDTDDHEVPCNAPRSRGCIGRQPTPPAATEGETP